MTREFEARTRLVLIHEVPGRVRLRCEGLREQPLLSDVVQSLTRDLPGLDEVSIRPGSESLVLRYSLEECTPTAFMGALHDRFDLMAHTRSSAPADEPIGAQLIRGSRIGWNRADRYVFQVTRGRLDLQSSVPWAMLFLALRQIAINPNLPSFPWYTALYYALQAILRYPDEKPGADGAPAPTRQND